MNISKTFQFHINAEHYTYSFSLPIIQVDTYIMHNRECVKMDNVVTSILRHPEFEGQVSNPLLANGKEVRSIESFEEDLDNFVKKLNDKHQLIERDLVQDVLTQVCIEHINRCGRLMYVDLLMYVDVYICVLFAIYNEKTETYHFEYYNAVYLILNRFPKDIKFVGIAGDLYSWDDVN